MQPNHPSLGKDRRIGQACASLTILVGLAALLFRARVLLAGQLSETAGSAVPGLSAIAFVLLGGGLLVYSTWPDARKSLMISHSAALVVALIGLWNLSISLAAFDPLTALSPAWMTPHWLRVSGEPPVQASLMVLASLALWSVTANPAVWRLAHDLAISTTTALLVSDLILMVGVLVKYFPVGTRWSLPVALPTVAAFFALAMGLLARSDALSRPPRSYLSTVVTLVLGILFSIYLFVTVDQFERNQVITAFQQRARGLSSAVARSVDSDLSQIDSLTSFFAASDTITRENFRTFITPALFRHPGIRAFSWYVVVQDADRARFEQAAQAEGLQGFQFVEPGPDGRMVRAPRRYQYVVVYYVAPVAGNENVLGYNLASDPVRWESIQIARDSGARTATPLIPLQPSSRSESGFLVFQPVYQKGTSTLSVPDRQQNLVGFISGVFSLQNMVGISLKGLEQDGLTVNIFDSTDEANPVLMFSNNNIEKVVDNELYWIDSFPVANRLWTVECYSDIPLSSSQRTGQAWSVLVAGIFLTTLFCSYLLTTRRRNDEIRAAQAALRESALQLQAVVESANDAIVSANEKGEIVSWNRGAEKMFGYGLGEVQGKPLTILIPTRYQDDYRIGMDWVATVDRVPMLGKTFELDGLRKDGQEFPMEFTFSTYHVQGRVYISAILRDISERKDAERRLRYLSTHDSLTGLFNRAYFEAEIERLEHGRRFPVSLIVADLDDFKLINDSFGHEAGDRALRCAGEVLRAPFRSEDLVARIGGDEFAILLPGTDKEIAEQTIQRIRQEQHRHNLSVEGHVPIQFSLGVYTAEIGDTVSNAYNQADLRMYQDKAINKKKNRQN